MPGRKAAVRARIERSGFRAAYRLADLTYALGVATPKRTVAGTYWSYEPTNPHGDDPGLAALDALADDAVVLDVGAHVGEHAIPLARGTDRRLVALEPNGESADRLVRNVRRNGLDGRIDLRRAGAGAASASLTFYRSTFSKCSAFDRELATRWGARVAETEQVPVYRIDDLVSGVGASEGGAETAPSGPESVQGGTEAATTAPIPPPDAIKIDVEGREAGVLRGAAATVAAYRPLLVVEVHEASGGSSADGGTGDTATSSDALRAWLTDRGYGVETAGDVWVCRATGDRTGEKRREAGPE